jgi:hypothetical protein
LLSRIIGLRPESGRPTCDSQTEQMHQSPSADKLVAQGIEAVADLYRRGILMPAKGQPGYPNLGALYETRTPIEQRLYRMLIDERGAVIHGDFHMDPCYFTWDGQGALKRSLLEIQQEAREMIARSHPR